MKGENEVNERNDDRLERLVRFCLGFPAFLAGLSFLEVQALPWTKWLPGGVFLGLAFSMWLGGGQANRTEARGKSDSEDRINRRTRKKKHHWISKI